MNREKAIRQYQRTLEALEELEEKKKQELKLLRQEMSDVHFALRQLTR